MNIYDVSEKAGVSIATVSRVLNGNAKVSEKTRAKVLAVMEEMGYTPNVFARGLGLDTMKTIGILCVDSSDQFMASAVYYIEQELRNYGYDVILCCTGYEWETKKKYMELLLSKRVDAVILIASSFVEQTKEKNRYILESAKQVPIIVLNGYLDGNNVYCALCDDEEAMCRVTKVYLRAGKKNILYIGRRLSYSGICKRNGFIRAYEEMGVKLRKNQILMLDAPVEDVRNVLIERARHGFLSEVILACDEEIAIGAVKAAGALGISIPDSLEIVGYNNSKLSVCSEPELTSVDNKLEFCCMNAVHMLMKALEGSQVPSRIAISADIVVRGTTTVDFKTTAHADGRQQGKTDR